MSSRLLSRRFLPLFFLASICLFPAHAYAWEGVVVRVVDGDTLIVAPDGFGQLAVSVRLYGIDAPEMDAPGGKESKAALERLVKPGDTVTILTMESDRYDRLVGVVTGSYGILNVEQLRNGHARVDEKYCRARFCGEWEGEEKPTR